MKTAYPIILTHNEGGYLVYAPPASSALPKCGEGEIAVFALVDFDAYRRANDMRAVRKNVTIPNYLNELAVKAGINFSQVLQEGLKQCLGVP